MDKKIIKHIQELMKINDILAESGAMHKNDATFLNDELVGIRKQMLEADKIYDDLWEKEQKMLNGKKVKA